MATTSPSPNSTPSATSPSPAIISPPPSDTTSPPSSNNTLPPSQSSSSSPPPSLPNANPSDPPSSSVSSPPPPVPVSPPPATPPTVPSPPPPVPSSSPPPPQSDPPTVPSPPPPNASQPPTSSSSPPPPSPSNSSSSPPPSNSSSSPPPPPPSDPPTNPTSPPPPSSSQPPESSPPPPSSEPPQSPPPTKNSPPPPPPVPSRKSPPPPASNPPENSPPPPASNPPENSPPPPTGEPPDNAPPPPRLVSPPASHPPPSPSNSTPTLSPPPPLIRLSPPPSQTSVPENTPTNGSSPNAPESSNSSGNNSIGLGGVVAIGVAVGILVLTLVGLAFWCLRKRRKDVSGINGGYVMPSPMGSSPRSDSSFLKTQMQSSAPLVGSGSGSGSVVYSPSEPGGLGNSRSWFTYEELLEATNGFSTQNLLGEGGFGFVFKGLLPDGREVAVKQLKIGGDQGEREFKAEVEIISRIHHRHLVSLVGYCISESRRLLVYDYVPRNNLYYHLHGEGRPVLEWSIRVKIAAGAARGITYLHEDCHPRIIHRDIKSSNILLDNNFEARVSDFGLAKLALDSNTHVTTRVMGTFGCMAPEYASSGKLTEKSDVFSFGVVLLELITGRKPVDTSQPLGDESLVEWARPLLGHALDTGNFEDLTDPRIGSNYTDSEMFRMIEAAAACVRHSAARRPRMGQVVRAFDSLATEDLSNGMKVGESEVFNSAQQSAEIRWFRRMAFGSQNYQTNFFSQNDSISREAHEEC